MIKTYFYNDSFYKKIIKKKNDKRIKEEYKKILRYKKMIKFVYQNKPLGTGDAVLKTKIENIKGMLKNTRFQIYPCYSNEFDKNPLSKRVS